MLHRLFSVASALSLLLCLASVTVWLRGYHVMDSLERDEVVRLRKDCTRERSMALDNNYGAIVFSDLLDLAGPWQSGLPNSLPPRYTWETIFPQGAYPGVNLQLEERVGGMRQHATAFEFAGLAFVRNVETQPTYVHRYTLLIVPWIMIVALAALLPMVWISRWTLRRRRSACVPSPCCSCGYSLHGNTSGICPECGTKISTFDGKPEMPSESFI